MTSKHPPFLWTMPIGIVTALSAIVVFASIGDRDGRLDKSEWVALVVPIVVLVAVCAFDLWRIGSYLKRQA